MLIWAGPEEVDSGGLEGPPGSLIEIHLLGIARRPAT